MRLKGYRTVIFGALATGIGIMEAVVPTLLQIAGLPEFQGVLPDSWLPWVLLIVAIGSLYFRKITTTPLGKDQ